MRIFWWGIFLLLPTVGFSQYQFRQLNFRTNLKQDSWIYEHRPDAHTGIRPFNTSSIPKDSLNLTGSTGSWLKRKWSFEHLVEVENEEYAFSLDPIVNFQFGYEANEPSRYTNTRGYHLQGRIGKKISFYSIFLENQARMPDYIMRYGETRRVIPGQGSLVRDFGTGGYDYGFFAGEVSYETNKHFTFTLGQGRNFFGEGYRSLLLSDGAFSYPFFRIETNVWIFKYVNLWAQLYDPRREAQVYKGVLAKKFLSSHFLSTQITKRWNFAVFEAIVYGDTNQLQGLDASFLNPIVFYRPVEFAVGSRNGNALMGAQTSYTFPKARVAYAQFLLDEFNLASILASEGSWVNKFAWQLGIKDYDAFGIKGLFMRLEYNAVRPYTYSHRVVLTNYAHYGSPLAHPWGANFHELVFQNIYQNGPWEAEMQFNYGLIGNDGSDENYGSDVYVSYDSREQDLNNTIAQGRRGNYYFLSTRLAYLVNPSSGLKVELGMRYRDYITNQSQVQNGPMYEDRSLIFTFGLRTELYNRYFDQ